MNNFDVIVAGAGHAGIEAALACARTGLKTALFTLSLDAVANMPCNPSVGGTGKGHLVFEIDALGGEMGFAADSATIQSRMLNTGKGAAVRSKRVQADRTLYRDMMKRTLENTASLRLIQAEVTKVITEKCGTAQRVVGVYAEPGGEFSAKAVIIASGTHLGGTTHTGDVTRRSGPDGLLPSEGLTDCLTSLGIRMMRFKTGTPPRIHRRSIDFSTLEVQHGDDYIVPFSHRTDEAKLNSITQSDCHVVYTNESTHQIIRDNIHRSPLYSGKIHGVGPRYCPSIEDKIMRFADKERHQLFVEPVGLDTDEIYLQGFSSSLPADVQYKMLRSLKGFESAEIMRYAYAIEYDCTDPTELLPTLEFKNVKGLYGAGQLNGSSGYEEAAAQGLVAGMNASLAVRGEAQIILPRQSSYIGTLIDDLVTKGTAEPYRIMTSRSEFRLLLRQDNAECRLTEYGVRSGLVSRERAEAVWEHERMISDECERLEHVNFGPSAVNSLLESKGTTPISSGISAADMIRRPQMTIGDVISLDPKLTQLSSSDLHRVETEIKYAGYVKRQLDEASRQAKSENTALPEDIDYSSIRGLRLEAAEKLSKIRPASIGQASRISGVSPADISVLLIWLSMNK